MHETIHVLCILLVYGILFLLQYFLSLNSSLIVIIFTQFLPHTVFLPAFSLKGAVLILDIPIAWKEYTFVRVQHGVP